jgi:hypothetical protein
MTGNYKRPEAEHLVDSLESAYWAFQAAAVECTALHSSGLRLAVK